MSKINPPRWSEPLTGAGVRVDDATSYGRSAPFHLHEVGAFTMDDTWNYRAVCSPFWRFYHNNDSGATVSSRDQVLPLENKSGLLLPPGLIYDCHGASGVRHLWLHFSYTDRSFNHGMAATPIRLPQGALALLKELRETVTHNPPERLRIRHLGLSLLHRIWAEKPDTSRLPLSERLDRAFRWMDSRLGEPPDIAALAKAVGLTPGGLARWFGRCTGKTPAKFLMERRLQEAARLLRYTEISVEEVAESTGFADRHHLSHAFSRHFGKGPATFRR